MHSNIFPEQKKFRHNLKLHVNHDVLKDYFVPLKINDVISSEIFFKISLLVTLMPLILTVLPMSITFQCYVKLDFKFAIILMVNHVGEQ